VVDKSVHHNHSFLISMLLFKILVVLSSIIGDLVPLSNLVLNVQCKVAMEYLLLYLDGLATLRFQ
jgi:hypothetical protein